MITLKDAEHNLKHRLPFNAGNLWAIRNEARNRYEVYSYQALIAYSSYAPNTASIISNERYSQTTSKHQNIVRRAWGAVN